jgi:hypothetical protein
MFGIPRRLLTAAVMLLYTKKFPHHEFVNTDVLNLLLIHQMSESTRAAECIDLEYELLSLGMFSNMWTLRFRFYSMWLENYWCACVCFLYNLSTANFEHESNWCWNESSVNVVPNSVRSRVWDLLEVYIRIFLPRMVTQSWRISGNLNINYVRTDSLGYTLQVCLPALFLNAMPN